MIAQTYLEIVKKKLQVAGHETFVALRMARQNAS